MWEMDDSAPFPGNRRLYPLDTHSLSFKRNLHARVDVFVEYTRFDASSCRGIGARIENETKEKFASTTTNLTIINPFANTILSLCKMPAERSKRSIDIFLFLLSSIFLFNKQRPSSSSTSGQVAHYLHYTFTLVNIITVSLLLNSNNYLLEHKYDI